LAQRQLHFVYGGRQVRDLAGEPILELLSDYGTRLHYYPVISMPEGDPRREHWHGRTGLITEAASALFGDKLNEFEIYFAGPPAMETAVVQLMHAAKVPQAQVHYDQFY